jgi:TolA-binding protein
VAKRISRKELAHDEFIDAAFDFGHWLEQHWRGLGMAVGGAVLVVIATLLWIAWSRQAEEKASIQLASGIGVYQEALADGAGDPAGLESALKTFDALAGSRGGPASLARFYRGATLFHLGRLDEARESLEQVVNESGAADTLGATAQLLLAQVELAAGHTDEAAALLQRLADQAEAAVPPEQALLELARLHEQAGQADKAQIQWQRIVDEYPQSGAAALARTELR